MLATPLPNRCDGSVLEPMIKNLGGFRTVYHTVGPCTLLSLPLLPPPPPQKKQPKGGFPPPPKKPRKTTMLQKIHSIDIYYDHLTARRDPIAGLDTHCPNGCCANCRCRRRGWTRGECEGKRGASFSSSACRGKGAHNPNLHQFLVDMYKKAGYSPTYQPHLNKPQPHNHSNPTQEPLIPGPDNPQTSSSEPPPSKTPPPADGRYMISQTAMWT